MRRETIPPFGTSAIDVGRLLPQLHWPAQIEIEAGRHFVRPRYEVVRSDGVRRIAHVNVERTDLRPDPAIGELGRAFGKGFILPAPVLPISNHRRTTRPAGCVGEQHRDADGAPCRVRGEGRVDG